MRAFLGEPLTVDALRSDAYVESLLASAERRAPTVPTDVDLDQEVAWESAAGVKSVKLAQVVKEIETALGCLGA